MRAFFATLLKEIPAAPLAEIFLRYRLEDIGISSIYGFKIDK